ncbi:MAG: N-acetylglucosamine-6-phosphate deacetylase [Ilumatobacteraceae bacterium]
MTTLAFRNADALIDGRLDRVDIVVDGGWIVEVGDAPVTGRVDTVDCAGLVIAPGYIDLQCNGAVGVDLTTEPDRVGEVGGALPRFGVTAFLPTVITCPAAGRVAALAALGGSRPSIGDGAALPLGLHLEGPALSPRRLGAHPPALVVGADQLAPEVTDWVDSGCVAMVTLAPELDGAMELIEQLAAGGVTVAAGHTTMTPAVLAAAKRAGLRYVTHLFNAMEHFDHRAPGPVGATLADDDVVAGLICDGVHVDPVAVKMAWNALGPSRTSLVSDAVAALGEPYGTLRLGGVEVIHDETGVRLVDGTLAGSSLALDQAVRNLLSFTGCTLADALATVTSVPSDVLGLTDRGRLEVGARADLVLLDHDANLLATIIGGEVVHGRV